MFMVKPTLPKGVVAQVRLVTTKLDYTTADMVKTPVFWLTYALFVRKEGWPDWIRLTADPITDRNYSWDTTAFPSGLYRVKVVASPMMMPVPAISPSSERPR